MTNIIAAIVVTLATNVTEDGPKYYQSMPCPGAYQNGVIHAVACGEWRRVPDAKEKWVTTSVIERHTLRFDWNGPREVVSERVLSSITTTQKLEWVKQ